MNPTEPALSASALASRMPAPHHVVSPFLGRKGVDQLLDYCIGNEAAFAAASVGDGKQALIDGQLRRSRSLAIPDEFAHAVHAEFRRRLAIMLPDLIAALKLSPFDTFTGAADLPPTQRMISAVYYFHAAPKAFSGGALRLHPVLGGGEDGSWVDVDPVCDSLVCFPSFAPHEVRPIACPSGRFSDSRFAINTWICRDDPAIAGARR